MFGEHLARKLNCLDIVAADKHFIALREDSVHRCDRDTLSQLEVHKGIARLQFAVIGLSILAVDHHLG